MARTWIAGSDVLSMFPTLVWRFELEPSTRTRINDRVLAIIAREAPEQPGAWQSTDHALHRRPVMAELVGCIEDAVRSVLEFLAVGHGGSEITGCWANVNPPGASHRRHSHPNNYLSGVYYVEAPPGACTINFHDPRVQTSVIRPPVRALTCANADQVVVTVMAGTLLLFPAFLEHSVDANASSSRRVSISFNVMFSGFAETMSQPLW